jgi:hypothetical protein
MAAAAAAAAAIDEDDDEDTASVVSNVTVSTITTSTATSNLPAEAAAKRSRKRGLKPPVPKCVVCDNAFNKTYALPIQCEYCDFVACRTCCQQYVLSQQSTPKCMNPDGKCQREWTPYFMRRHLTSRFINERWRSHRMEFYFDTEKSMLPDAQGLIELRNERKQILWNIRQVDAEIALVQERRRRITASLVAMEERIRFRERTGVDNPALSHVDRHARVLAADEVAPAQKYMRPCPADDCRGFLNHMWTCGICRTKVCKDCHEIVGRCLLKKNRPAATPVAREAAAVAAAAASDDPFLGVVLSDEEEDDPPRPHRSRDASNSGDDDDDDDFVPLDDAFVSMEADHVCRPENVASAKEVMSHSKPCPKCGVFIFKIDGCNQMFCTHCHTAFDWRTLAISTGAIHNPHYFAWLESTGRGGGGAAGAHAPPVGGNCDNDNINNHLAYVFHNRLHSLMRQLATPGVVVDEERSASWYAPRGGPAGRRADNERHVDSVAISVRCREMLRKIMHLRYAVLARFATDRRDAEETRVRFLQKEITEDEFKRRVYIMRNHAMKNGELTQLIEMVIMATSSIFRRIYTDLLEPPNCPFSNREDLMTAIFERLQEVFAVVEYANENLADLAVTYATSQKYYLDYSLEWLSIPRSRTVEMTRPTVSDFSYL